MHLDHSVLFQKTALTALREKRGDKQNRYGRAGARGRRPGCSGIAEGTVVATEHVSAETTAKVGCREALDLSIAG